MKILSADQIKQADAFTIENLPIASIDLMEKAAKAFVEIFCTKVFPSQTVYCFCGSGNNGGDGYAISRLLLSKGYDVEVYVIGKTVHFTTDADENLKRLQETPSAVISQIFSHNDFPQIKNDAVIIDAIFGIGLNRPLQGLFAEVVAWLNLQEALKFAVDIPSGLFADEANSEKDIIFKANFTISFQLPKFSFLLCQNEVYTGKWFTVDIGLHEKFLSEAASEHFVIDLIRVKSIFKQRERCSHKGSYGHVLLIAGSYGKTGAALLSGKACLRAGAGLLSVSIPKSSYEIYQTYLPEAMVLTSGKKKVDALPEDFNKFDVIAIGPGLGTDDKTKVILKQLLLPYSNAMVLDADALNIISMDKHLLNAIPKNTVLTPHPKEFDRLTQKHSNDWERIRSAKEFAVKYECILILKNAYTSIHLPNGETFFNICGNAGMAKGGSGDTLTGVIAALLAQGYNAKESAILGVWLHGKAGDIAKAQKSMHSMLATDLIENLGEVFKMLEME